MEISAHMYSIGGVQAMTLQELFGNSHTPEIDRMCQDLKEYSKDMIPDPVTQEALERISHATLHLTQMVHCYIRSEKYQSSKTRLQRKHGHFCSETALEAIEFYTFGKKYMGFSKADYLVVFALEKIMSSLTKVGQDSADFFQDNLDDANSTILMLMRDDGNIKNLRTGKKLRKRQKPNSEAGGAATKKNAEERNKMLLDTAYKIAFENPGKYFSTDIANKTLRSHPDNKMKPDTLRKKLTHDPRINPLLKRNTLNFK